MNFTKKISAQYRKVTAMDRFETLEQIKELVSDLKADCYHLDTHHFDTIEQILKAIEKQMETD